MSQYLLCLLLALIALAIMEMIKLIRKEGRFQFDAVNQGQETFRRSIIIRNPKKVIYGLLTLALLIVIPRTASIALTRPPDTPARPVTPATAAVPPTVSPSPRPASPSICTVVSKFDGNVGIYAKNLKTGQVITLNPDKIFAAASTIKVPVSIVVYKSFYDQAGFFEQLFYDTGVGLMMTISDNNYFAEFLDEIEENIGPDKIRELFSHIGLTKTTIRDAQARNDFGYTNVTTAKEMALIFEHLYHGHLISAEKTDFMLDAMSHSIFPDEMARYMQDRRVIHKIGELDDVLADVGIVEGPGGPVLLSIYTETPVGVDYASDYIAASSACLYTALSGESTSWSGEGSLGKH
jgi:beta-lactamase class A